jgi:hypothetical protein
LSAPVLSLRGFFFSDSAPTGDCALVFVVSVIFESFFLGVEVNAVAALSSAGASVEMHLQMIWPVKGMYVYCLSGAGVMSSNGCTWTRHHSAQSTYNFGPPTPSTSIPAREWPHDEMRRAQDGCRRRLVQGLVFADERLHLLGKLSHG